MTGAGKQFGPYTMGEEIARGGQGAVLRAHHTATGQPVAIKILLDRTPARRKRFLQEAAVLTKLNHPNLLRVIDHGEHNGLVFMAMEFVEGRDIKTIVAQGGIPEYAWTARVLSEVADALEHCHQQGVVHRDVKPANVLIETGTGRTVLVDFGMLKRDPQKLGVSILDDGTRFSQTSELKGTPAFMSPEQINPQKYGDVSARTDVYALGATLYVLLTDRHPFETESLASLLAQVLGAEPDPPREANPKAPRDLCDLALRCLSKEPKGRPASAAEVAEVLRAGSTSGAPAATRGGRAPLLALSALLNVALLIGLGLVLGTRGSGPDLEARWERAAAGDPAHLIAAELDALEADLAGDPRAAWLPALRARAALAEPDVFSVGPLHPRAAELLGAVPEGPNRSLLLAERLVHSPEHGDLLAAFDALDACAEANLPWVTPQTVPELWFALAEALEEARGAASNERALGPATARAWLRAVSATGSVEIAGAGDVPVTALDRIERAFELDALEAARHADSVADLLLRSAAAVFAGPADPARADLYRRARHWLVVLRMTRPAAALPGDLLDDLRRVGTHENAAIQRAALPGCGHWMSRNDALFALLAQPLDPSHPVRGASNERPRNVLGPWKEWIERALSQDPWLNRHMFQEWLLWRPEAAMVWRLLGQLEEKAGVGRQPWGAVAYSAALDLEEVDRARALYRLGHSLSNLQRFEEADPHLREAIRLGKTYDNGNAQWAGLQLAWNLYDQGRYPEALATLDDMRQVWMGGRPGYWQVRVAVLEALGRADEAALRAPDPPTRPGGRRRLSAAGPAT